MRTVFITGGAGFIGSALTLAWAREHPSDRVVVVDALTYAGHRVSLLSLQDNPRFRLAHADITDAAAMEALFADEKPELLLHLAAESHVDRSIHGPMAFVQANVVGTQVLLECVRKQGVRRMVHVSTDEVYGPTPEGTWFDENAAFHASSPYSATKAGADLLVQSYIKTFKLDLVITRGSNTYGPRQTPEKLVPLMITRASADETLPIYGDGQYKRDWIFVEDHAAGIMAAALRGSGGNAYNLGAGNERANLEMVKGILHRVGKPESLIRFVTDRPAHDRRYALNVEKAARDLGFRAQVPLEDGLGRTVAWYRDNAAWVAEVKRKQGEFNAAWYDGRLKGASTETKTVTAAPERAR